MTLRDHYACIVLTALIQRTARELSPAEIERLRLDVNKHQWELPDYDNLSQNAYLAADAMLRARKAKP